MMKIFYPVYDGSQLLNLSFQFSIYCTETDRYLSLHCFWRITDFIPKIPNLFTFLCYFDPIYPEQIDNYFLSQRGQG